MGLFCSWNCVIFFFCGGCYVTHIEVKDLPTIRERTTVLGVRLSPILEYCWVLLWVLWVLWVERLRVTSNCTTVSMVNYSEIQACSSWIQYILQTSKVYAIFLYHRHILSNFCGRVLWAPVNPLRKCVCFCKLIFARRLNLFWGGGGIFGPWENPPSRRRKTKSICSRVDRDWQNTWKNSGSTVHL